VGEKAVALQADRLLGLAGQRLEELREHAHQEEVTKLWKAKRFADVRALHLRSIEEIQAIAGRPRHCPEPARFGGRAQGVEAEE
jgi:hypothetical protein